MYLQELVMYSNNYIGCSGYYYPAWKNKFYPKGIAPKDWLAYYSTQFNTVELNGTFYRTPKLSDLQKYARVTGDAFSFSVKMSRYITHVLKLKQSKQAVLDFQELMTEGLGNKLRCFLFQLPPSFQYSEQNLEILLENIPHSSVNCVELRHGSWWNDTVQNAFEKAGLTFCNVDFPGMQTYFIQSSDRFYLRLHGNPELFKSSYTEMELLDLSRHLPTGCRQYNVYFNNTFYEAGYTNARQLIDILEREE